jgi:Tol biopolymer transport system component
MRNNPSQYIEPAGWTPDGKQVLVTQQAEDKIWQIAMVSVANGTSRVLKSLKWGGINARISPDGRFVAYSAPVEGSANSQNDIYIVAADGSTHAVAVDHPANDYGMVWSSDGSKLLFLSLRTGAPSLWMIPVKEGKAAGEAQLVKPNFDSRLLGMSRDGRLYYLAGTSAQNIYRAEVDPDGKVSKAPVVATDSFVNVNRGGQISPDGQRIAYYSYRPQPVIVVKSLLTGEERVIPASLNFRSVYFLGPRWFADGNSVLVDATENDRPDTHHYRIDLATGRVEEILRGLQGEQFTPAPFGNVVYYRSGTVGLMRHDLDTGISTRILPPEPIALQFTVSRDGKQLAFMTVVDGMKIYSVIAAAGGEPREVYRLPSSDGPDRFNALEWSPDQKYLILVVADEGVSPFRERNSLWRVKVEGGSAERLGVTMSGRFKSPFLHPNGKQLFFTSIRTDSELWALENFLTATPRP